MHYTIYRTINRVNGRYYIGSHKTEDPEDGYLGSGTRLLRAVEKYGVENIVEAESNNGSLAQVGRAGGS